MRLRISVTFFLFIPNFFFVSLEKKFRLRLQFNIKIGCLNISLITSQNASPNPLANGLRHFAPLVLFTSIAKKPNHNKINATQSLNLKIFFTKIISLFVIFLTKLYSHLPKLQIPLSAVVNYGFFLIQFYFRRNCISII